MTDTDLGAGLSADAAGARAAIAAWLGAVVPRGDAGPPARRAARRAGDGGVRRMGQSARYLHFEITHTDGWGQGHMALATPACS